MGRGHDSTSVDVSDELANAVAVSDELDAGEIDEAAFALKPADGPDGQVGLPAAFELIAEACAAVKIAEDRASLADKALEESELYYVEQIEALTRKLDVADRRADIAERQARQAEERLRIFCRTIVTTMHNI